MKNKDEKRQREAKLYRQTVPTALKKGELRKLEIIQATIRCLHERGLDATNYETIGQLCGMQRPHVAYHFPRKEALVEAAIRYVYSAGQEVVVETMKRAPAGGLLLAYVRGSFAWVADEPAYGSVVALLGYLSTREPAFREMSREFRRIGPRQIGDVRVIGEILDGRGNKDDVARALGVHPFVAEKTTGQAGRFSMEALEGIYHRLLKIDEQVKTSQITLDLSLDTLVVELAR